MKRSKEGPTKERMDKAELVGPSDRVGVPNTWEILWLYFILDSALGVPLLCCNSDISSGVLGCLRTQKNLSNHGTIIRAEITC